MNKFLRFLRLDSQVQKKIFVLLSVGAFFLVQLMLWQGQSRMLSQAKAQKKLVGLIPSMEKFIRSHTIRTDQSGTVTQVKLNLDGITIKEGVPYALIDGEVYAAGDLIGNYKVENILMEQGGQVILKDQETQETKTLYVPEPK